MRTYKEVDMKVLFPFVIFALHVVLSDVQYEIIPVDLKEGGDYVDCVCVPYYQCSNGSVIQDGATLIDPRIKDASCENYLDVCCKTPPLQSPLGPVIKKTPYKTEGCGIRNTLGVGFRISGTENEAQFGEFPWMVAVLLLAENDEPARGSESYDAQPTNPLYLCGGSIIHPSVVLTAAHSVFEYQASPLLVRAGEWDSQTDKEVYPHQDREVIEVIIHEAYKRESLINDVALLILIEPLRLSEHIGIVCLPPQGLFPTSGTRCIASGWGKDSFGIEGKYQVILKKVELPVVYHEKCQQILRKTRLGRFFKLDYSFMCAGGEGGADTCKGDGGSPLVCPHPDNPDRYMQTGIVAWGIGCQDQGTPGVYANVAIFRDWIDEKMLENDMETSYYSI